MTATAPIRWGILGPGGIAKAFAGGVAGSRNGKLVAIGARNPGKPGLAESFPGARIVDGYEALLAVVAIILGTITLPYAVVLIPQFIMVARDFQLANTWVALIVPPLFNSLGVLFMRQSFSMMPDDLFDAARVEGVKEWRIFVFVALPLARPMLAALCIILFLASWNNYLWPLLINSQPGSMTAPVALGTLIGLTKVSWGGIMAGAVMLTVPMLIVFVLLQRHFIAGIAAGAVK